MALFVVLLTLWPASQVLAQQAPVEDLVKQLGSGDAAARTRAADGLAHLGAKASSAVPALTKALSDPDDNVRWRAARALGAMGPAARGAVPALVKGLGDKHPLARAHAANTLGRIGDVGSDAITALGERITDADPRVRRSAILALERIRPGPAVSIPLLVKVLGDSDPSVVVPAIDSLADLGPKVVPLMVEALKDEKARYWACLVLAEIGPDAGGAVEGLTEVLSDDRPEVRMQALMALGEIGPSAGSAAGPIISALDDEQMSVRYCASYALGRMRAPGATNALKKSLETDDEFLRMIAAWALARCNPDDKQLAESAVMLIVKGLESENPNVRAGAARALFELEAPTDPAIEALVASLGDSEPKVLANALDALAALGSKAVPKLATALQKEEVRSLAVQILARMGPGAKEAVPALVEAMKTDDPEFRREVHFALASIGGPDSAPALDGLIEALNSDTDIVRNSACYALGKMGSAAAPAIGPLRKNLKSDDPFFRMASAWALLQIQPGDKDVVAVAVPLLTEHLTDEREQLRYEIAVALGNIGPPAKPAIPALEKALDDESEAVAKAAAEALKKIRQ